MAGLVPEGVERETVQPTHLENLRWAAVEAARPVATWIEPINTRDIPRFFLNRQGHAHEIVAGSARSTCRCRWTCTTARSSRATWR
jgi:hydroxypyruvate isomerase